MFDTYLVKCPKCGTINDEQSKSGPCILGVYELKDADDLEIAYAFDGLEFKCESCGTKYRTINKSKPTIVTEIIE